MRQLRRHQTEVEEENALLSDRVDKLRQDMYNLQQEVVSVKFLCPQKNEPFFDVDITSQVEQQRNNNNSLLQHLNMLRSYVVDKLRGITFPGFHFY